MLRENKQTLDERNWNLRNLLSENSSWVLLKVCNLENFNRSYVGYDQFQICNLHNQLLNLEGYVNQSEAKYPISFDSDTFP